MEQQLDRIATAFERIAEALESINENGLGVDLIGGFDELVVHHEFNEAGIPIDTLYVESANLDGFKLAQNK
jgi:predicted amino acid dehydrogenase